MSTDKAWIIKRRRDLSQQMKARTAKAFKSGHTLFASESVGEGHPDKVCDQVSDAIVDAVLSEVSHARVACEALAKTGIVIVAGELNSCGEKLHVDFEGIVRKTICDIGYVDDALGLNGHKCAFGNFLSKQSSDIAQGTKHDIVHEGDDFLGAGDQGHMFGYACSETSEYMPMPITYSHNILKKLSELRRAGGGYAKYLRPDAKSQITVEYGDKKPIKIAAVVVAQQHAEEVDLKTLHEFVVEEAVKKVIPSHLLDDDTVYITNGTGTFIVGGPEGDCGLTGRKIIVDTYGGSARHGGGAFSGKDPSKVDRSAAYMARHLAKSIVGNGYAAEAEVQLAYCIGIDTPLSVSVNTFGTAAKGLDDKRLTDMLQDNFDLTPAGIIGYLMLERPIYRTTASYGHFGRPVSIDENGNTQFTWERIHKF